MNGTQSESEPLASGSIAGPTLAVEDSVPTIPYNREAIYTSLTTYNEEEDEEFQAGLQTILAPLSASADLTPEQINNTKLRAKAFYWSQKFNVPIDFNDYQTWVQCQHTHPSSSSVAAVAGGASSTTIPATSSASASASASVGDEMSQTPTQPQKEDKDPYPASFDAIVELITTGKTDQIPGIKEIPLQINQAPPTQPRLDKPLKPWERNNITSTNDSSIHTDPSATLQEQQQVPENNSSLSSAVHFSSDQMSSQ